MLNLALRPWIAVIRIPPAPLDSRRIPALPSAGRTDMGAAITQQVSAARWDADRKRKKICFSTGRKGTCVLVISGADASQVCQVYPAETAES